MTNTFTPDERERYSRHLRLAGFGAVSQARLRTARVLIVGAGGLGSPAALYLAAAGVGTLGLVDFDRVDVSNLQRQILFGTADVGRSKVETAREHLLALNPGIEIVAHDTRLGADNVSDIVGAYDLTIDGSDRLPVRYLVNDACVILRKPLISAAILGFEGQAMTYMPGRGPCYRCLFPAGAEAIAPSCADAGVLGVLPGVLGALQATEAIKIIAAIGEPLVGRLLTYDALALRFEEFRFAARADCAVCGYNPSITEPREISSMTAPDDANSIRRLTPTELQTAIESAPAGAKPFLVDVREPYEYEAGHLEGSLHIPLGQLQQRLGEIPRDSAPVFLCRVGGRSLKACAIALQAGIASPGNLEGGMLAWSREVDPDIDVA